MLLARLRAASRRPPLWRAAISRRALSSAPREGEIDMERFDEIEEDMQQAFLERFSGPLPKLREPPTPPADSLPLETWAPPSLVSAEYEQNVLSFRTRYFHDSSEWTPPETKKVVLRVMPHRLGLNRDERRRLRAVVGLDRYPVSSGQLKLTCSRHMEPHRNKQALREMLELLIADAKANPQRRDADDAQLPLAARSRPWPRHGKRRVRRVRARPPLPLQTPGVHRTHVD